MTVPAEAAELEALLWASATLFAARVDVDGVILAANPALGAWVGQDPVGMQARMLISQPQRPVFDRVLSESGDDWSQIGLALDAPKPHPADDRRILLRRRGDETLLVAEPDSPERERLVEQVLELNADLIAAQRTANRRQRALERAQAEARVAEDRVGRLESIMLAGLAAPDLEAVLDSLLGIARDVLGADRTAVLLRDERTLRLRVAAESGVADGESMRVPLVVDRVPIGALEVSPAGLDRGLLERVAERAALAIGHARLREREAAVAEALQRSVLPQGLPDIATVGLCARYLPRLDGVGVGGDFYDAVALPDGRVALSIGDVAGKGLGAASTMGRVCHALRAYALEASAPSEALARLDNMIVDEGNDMVTALQLFLDPATGVIDYANAGHPPPLRITRDGRTEWLGDALAPPLGSGVGRRGQATARLEPGDRLLAYTDGLIERRGETLDFGLAVLKDRAAAYGSVGELCNDLVDSMAGGEDFEDDVAVLAVGLHD